MIIGAGAVGVEFGSIYSRFGSKVTILEMLPRIVPVEDEEVLRRNSVALFLPGKHGIHAGETGTKAENVRNTENGVALTATLANGKTEELEAECLLVAVGRKPNTDNIGLEGTAVQLDRGFVKVDFTSTDRRVSRRLRYPGRYRRRHAATGSRGDCPEAMVRLCADIAGTARDAHQSQSDSGLHVVPNRESVQWD